MKILTAKDIKLLGDMDAKYGQTYFGEVEEQDAPVIFNLMKQVNIMPGDKIFAEEWADGHSKKGNPQTRLRKVKLSEPASNGPTQMFDNEVPNFEPTTGMPEITQIVSEETPSYEAGTNARWALKLATDTYKSALGVPDIDDGIAPDIIYDYAKWLLDSFAKLKNYSPGSDEKQTKEETAAGTGYAKAKAQAEKLRPESEEEWPEM